MKTKKQIKEKLTELHKHVANKNQLIRQEAAGEVIVLEWVLADGDLPVKRILEISRIFNVFGSTGW